MAMGQPNHGHMFYIQSNIHMCDVVNSSVDVKALPLQFQLTCRGLHYANLARF